MIFRQLDSTGDFVFGRGRNSFAAGADSIALNIKTRILSWTGDCFFSLLDFVDWKNRLDYGQETLLLEELKSVILGSYGVVGINSVTVTLENRVIRIRYNIRTIYSPSFVSTVNQSVGA